MAEWFETFFRGLYKEVLANQFDEATSLRQARLVKRLLEVRKGMRVLDIPCGMGRLTIPMAKMGLAVTGVDLTESFVRLARREARRQGLNARFICRDMRKIDYEAEFDAAFNWFASIGFFSDAEEVAFCARVLRALKPGGRFLVETVNKSWILAHFRPRFENTVGGVCKADENTWDPETQRMEIKSTLSSSRTEEHHRASVRLYDGPGMRRLLRAAGFREIELFGYPPLGSFTRHSRRLIAVARRPRD